MTKTEIIIFLGRNIRIEILNPLLKELEEFGLVESKTEKTRKGDLRRSGIFGENRS